jgi:hypothetical protein
MGWFIHSAARRHGDQLICVRIRRAVRDHCVVCGACLRVCGLPVAFVEMTTSRFIICYCHTADQHQRDCRRTCFLGQGPGIRPAAGCVSLRKDGPSRPCQEAANRAVPLFPLSFAQAWRRSSQCHEVQARKHDRRRSVFSGCGFAALDWLREFEPAACHYQRVDSAADIP